MNLFTTLITACLQEPKTTAKINLLKNYFKTEKIDYLPITLHLLMGNNFGRFCSGKLLREWCADMTNLPSWLVHESYEALGDNSETISLCFSPKPTKRDWSILDIYNEMITLKSKSIHEKKEWVCSKWQDLSANDIYTFNKLLGGGIRIGASKKNVLKALSLVTAIDIHVLEQRILGSWEPTRSHYQALVNPLAQDGLGLTPFPFFLASPIQSNLSSIVSTISDWLIEPKWDGIRAQLIHRSEGISIWSRGNELISNQFPELISKANQLPYGVYDGEIIAWKNNQPLPFYDLQKRLNRKNVSASLLKDVPCIMKLYDCLEFNGNDIRQEALYTRRAMLHSLNMPFLLSESLLFNNLNDLNHYIEQARSKKIEGVIIKRLKSTYQNGRVKGDWWKLKVNPLTLDTVIMYAQKGKGIRSGLFTDYTLGVWHNRELVPIGKAYSGLTNDEIKQVNQLLKKHLTDRFGPVRGVKPCVVLEIAFDDIHPSPRHKSGIALRFPRISRLRLDKPIEEANTLEDAQKLCQL